VPAILVNGGGAGRNAPISLHNGKLADVAPTLLELMGIEPPKDMTGHSLIVSPAAPGRAQA
jgi:2,3-bisphosphoglycerate-independent phosphoglycerate mutase